MADWYHSGIEGYCKSAAALMDMQGSGGWSAFGSELFPSRFDRADKASKTWTLSRFRRGNGNRLTAFEDEWLPDDSTLNAPVIREEAAVSACAAAMSAPVADGSEPLLAPLLLHDRSYRFASGFSDMVAPAIASGFQTEGYHSSDILRFTQNIDRLIGDVMPGDTQSFTPFAVALVAALVYGPGHKLATSSLSEETVWGDQGAQQQWMPKSEGDSLVISQIFGGDASFIGYSERFSESQAVFFGRSGNIGEHLDACRANLDVIDASLIAEIDGKDKVIFPIARSHRLVSNVHGALVKQGQNWYFFDFSSNGTSITGGGATRLVRRSGSTVNPGDIICLGASDPGSDIGFLNAASLLISFSVNEL